MLIINSRLALMMFDMVYWNLKILVEFMNHYIENSFLERTKYVLWACLEACSRFMSHKLFGFRRARLRHRTRLRCFRKAQETRKERHFQTWKNPTSPHWFNERLSYFQFISLHPTQFYFLLYLTIHPIMFNYHS